MMYLVFVILALSCHKCIAADELQDQQLLSSVDFTKLSEIRVRTINLPLNKKCNLYAATLQEIRSTERVDKLTLFADAITFLKQKKLPFKNPSAVLKELRLCHLNYSDDQVEAATSDDTGNSGDMKQELEVFQQQAALDKAQIAKLKQQLEDEKSTLARMQDLEKQLHEAEEELSRSRNELSFRADNSVANFERDNLRRELETMRQETTRDKTQLIELWRQLDGVKSELIEANIELRAREASISSISTSVGQKDAEMERLKIDLKDSKLKLDQQAAELKRQAESARQVEIRLGSEIEQLKAAHDSQSKELEFAVSKQDKIETLREPVLADRMDELEVLYNNFSPGRGRCFKYHLLLRQNRDLTPTEVITIAKLDTTGTNTIKYNMDRVMKLRVKDIYKNLLERGTDLHEEIASDLYDCAGFNDCRDGAQCEVLNVTPGLPFIFFE